MIDRPPLYIRLVAQLVKEYALRLKAIAGVMPAINEFGRFCESFGCIPMVKMDDAGGVHLVALAYHRTDIADVLRRMRLQDYQIGDPVHERMQSNPKSVELTCIIVKGNFHCRLNFSKVKEAAWPALAMTH